LSIRYKPAPKKDVEILDESMEQAVLSEAQQPLDQDQVLA